LGAPAYRQAGAEGLPYVSFVNVERSSVYA